MKLKLNKKVLFATLSIVVVGSSALTLRANTQYQVNETISYNTEVVSN